MRHTIKTVAAIAVFAAMTGNVHAKEWTSEVVTIGDNGQQQIVKTIKTCKYHETLKAARSLHDTTPNSYFSLKGVDDQTACPSKPRKPKAE